jgi:hypothetical protein
MISLLCVFSVSLWFVFSVFGIAGKTLALTEIAGGTIAAVLARCSKRPGVVKMGAR